MVLNENNKTGTLKMAHETWQFEQQVLYFSDLDTIKNLPCSEPFLITSMMGHLDQLLILYHHSQGFPAKNANANEYDDEEWKYIARVKGAMTNISCRSEYFVKPCCVQNE